MVQTSSAKLVKGQEPFTVLISTVYSVLAVTIINSRHSSWQCIFRPSEFVGLHMTLPCPLFEKFLRGQAGTVPGNVHAKCEFNLRHWQSVNIIIIIMARSDQP